MFEILDKETISKMTERELELSVAYYSYHYELIDAELYARGIVTEESSTDNVVSEKIDSSKIKSSKKGRKKRSV